MGAVASTSEVLNKAADLIEQRGWAKGPDAWGDEGDGTGSLCLEGGLLAATGLGRGWEFRSCPAYAAVKDYLVSTESLPPEHDLWEFNDKSAEERVVGVLRATALIEAAREQQTVEVG